MSITTYSALKTAVCNYLHRPSLASDVAECISRAESRIFRDFDASVTEKMISGTTSGSTIPYPSDCSQITRVSCTVASVETSLDYFAKPADYIATISQPRYFSLDQGAIRLHDAPGTGYTYKLYYIPELLPLSDTNTTNWLLDNADDLYMYASALEGARFLRNEVEAQKLQLICFGLDGRGGLLESLRQKMRGKALPMGGSLRIKPRR